jgi:hypothetical protein
MAVWRGRPRPRTYAAKASVFVLDYSLSPLRGFVFLTSIPTAGAVGCILAPLRGWLRCLLQAVTAGSTSALAVWPES